ncbi:class I SAM-dependent methyltransferase [Fictibacillus phosphorivorans]|uniref:class I SAM-dependent methyltransferase n=1 Tax=Fictibacillus phosphorivorans TaxID=1221500 RepID=UPI00203B42F6|nr:class I SAM-dependent methyltransferase [Fictibacillus phosphorivorans]MCM3718013.1 methyltransferase domain-containing protein [Fictibacillus phosphorivorans]MCM3775462.1 methyltransferase domain-containing protein [Fictibacillus phosphorivorans]
MKLEGVLPFARTLLRSFCTSGDLVIDATCGNGNDTLFLSKLVGEDGRVFAFDIQEQAIENSKLRLTQNQAADNVTFYHASHHEMMEQLPEFVHGNVSGAIFNLGYLPGSDKSITTKGSSTIDAIKQLLHILKPEGIIILVIYHGHEEGKREKELVLDFVKNIDQKKAHVLQYDFINQKNDPPFVVAIERRG